MSGETIARKEFDWLVLGPQPTASGSDAYAYPVDIPGEATVPLLGVTFVLKIVEPAGRAGEYNKMTGSVMDAGKLPRRLVLRNWRAGDRYWPSGNRKPRKLKELFRQRKIPRSRRNLWPVLVGGEQILWVRGFPPAASVAVTQESRMLLVVEEVAG